MDEPSMCRGVPGRGWRDDRPRRPRRLERGPGLHRRGEHAERARGQRRSRLLGDLRGSEFGSIGRTDADTGRGGDPFLIEYTVEPWGIAVDALPASCDGEPATVVAGARTTNGTPAADVIDGTGEGQTIHGEGGDDTICALGGNVTVKGGGGRDTAEGAGGRDTLNGGGGRDRLRGGPGTDVERQ